MIRCLIVKKLCSKYLENSQIVVYLILILLLVLAQILSPGYLNPTHMAGILRLASFMGIAAIGQNLTILTGGIDLSIANTITFANVIAAQIMMGRDSSMLPALLAVIVMGIVVGLINGTGVYWLKIPPFIMTLGVGTVIQGIFTKGKCSTIAPFHLRTEYVWYRIRYCSDLGSSCSDRHCTVT